MDQLYIGDEFDFESISDDMPPDEESEFYKEFIRECFPMLSETEIENFIREFRACNYSGSIFDFILNEETAHSYASSSSSPFTVKDDDDDDDHSSVPESRLIKPRKRKKKKKQVNSYYPNFESGGPTSEVPSWDNTRLQPPASTNSLSWDAQWNSYLPNFESGPTSEVPLWDNARLQSPASTKSSSWDAQWPPLPTTSPENKMMDFLNTSKRNVNSARNNNDQRESINRLSEIFPQYDNQLLGAILDAANGEVENAIDLLMDNTAGRSNNPFPSGDVFFGVETVEHKTDQEKKKNHGFIKSQSIYSSSRLFSSRSTRHENFSDDEASPDYDPEHCRKMIRDLTEKRNDAFKKASKAWNNSRNSRNGEGEIASHYSAMGHKFNEEMKEWQLRAARSMVRRRSKAGGDDHLLDLHGLTVKQALTVVKERLNKWYPRGTMRSGHTPLRPLKIITGVGNHSINGVAKLPDAVNHFLDKNDWNFSKGVGYVLVKGSKGY